MRKVVLAGTPSVLAVPDLDGSSDDGFLVCSVTAIGAVRTEPAAAVDNHGIRHGIAGDNGDIFSRVC